MGRDGRVSTLISSSAEETIAAGREIGKKLEGGTIVSLFGDLAAGKTTLIKGIVEVLTGVPPDQVVSPTFVYLSIYEGHHAVFHFDLYRLNTAAEFLSLGFEDYLVCGGICCIEWSERIESLLPPERIRIEMAHINKNERKIVVSHEALAI